ncbi:MAG TPA: ABC transporter ATP-binding protein [Terriglobales bacterium]|nr:ABC transporter ATP-binding protein [Terriglobales bacterium]
MEATSNPSSAIVLHGVSKIFGRFAALRDVSAEFAAGRAYAVFGDNGAGKSTLLRVTAGLARPTRGAVELLGSRDLRAVTGRLGYMAHSSLLYDEMSAMENLRYAASLYGILGSERPAHWIAAVGLDPALERRVGAYSQGMRQRLALARALVHDPDILLLDEPFSNVDVSSARAMTTLLGQMRDRGKTIVVVTHQAAHMAEVADESVYMSAGQIVARRRGVEAAQPQGARA